MQVQEIPALPEGLRRAYLGSLLEPQELYVETLVRAGRAHLLRRDTGDPIGYAVVNDATVVEFHLRPQALDCLPGAFELTLDHTRAARALCKTFDPLMLTAAAGRPARTRTTGHLFRTVRDRGFSPDPHVRDRYARATDTDVEAAWSINDAFFDDRAEIAAYAADRALVLYESADGELLGCGILTRTIPDHPTLDIGMLVARAHRRAGLGTYIASHLKATCLDAGDRPVCGCDVDNTASRRALQNAGFTTTHSLIEFTY